MAIQSSINSLLSQTQSLAAFYKGFEKAEDILGKQTEAANEAKIQTEIASGNAPMKDGKVDPDWLQKRRETYAELLFYPNGKISAVGKAKAQILQDKIDKGGKLNTLDTEFYNDNRVSEYLKSQSTNSKLKNKVASDLARASVEARTDSINQSKADFDEHTANLIKKYGKGSGNP